MYFLNRSYTNQTVQSQKQARSLKFLKKKRKCIISLAKNKGADQLRGYREDDLRLCFRIYADLGGSYPTWLDLFHLVLYLINWQRRSCWGV